MRTAFLILVCLHALIHVLGFVKGFGIKEIKELTLPVSKPMAVLWLGAAFLLFLFAVIESLNYKYAWLLGWVAIIASQILILLYWKDARFGTIPNIVILLFTITTYGSHRFWQQVQRETSVILDQAPAITKNMTEQDIMHLPDPIKLWLRHSGALGKPYTYLGRIEQNAELQMKPGQKQWMEATAIQYTTIDQPAFIWAVNARMNHLLYFLGRDKYENGSGKMLIKLNALFPIVNERGEKLDEGSLQRFLGEMVWFPSLALSPHIIWEEIDENSAKATMTYQGISGSGTFHFSPEGDFIRFSAMRFMGNEPESERREWLLQVMDYQIFENIKVPSKMTASWKLDDGDWTWLRLEVTDLKYNENALYQ